MYLAQLHIPHAVCVCVIIPTNILRHAHPWTLDEKRSAAHQTDIQILSTNIGITVWPSYFTHLRVFHDPKWTGPEILEKKNLRHGHEWIQKYLWFAFDIVIVHSLRLRDCFRKGKPKITHAYMIEHMWFLGANAQIS